jgi:hypothetical protein
MTSRFDRLLCVAGALGAGAGAAFLAYRMATLDAPQWAIPCRVLAALAVVALIAAVMRGGWLQRFVSGCIRLGLLTAITFAAAEAACRVLKLDFNELLGMRRANEAFPLYFRLPKHPSGEVFFTREPGSSWTGKPLQTLLKINRGTDNAYQQEADVTVRYSREGFRNPDDLTDWEIVVAGDSFTESGYVPEEATFVQIAAAQLGRRIKNLGMTDSGNLAQAHFLEAFGKAPSCKTSVLAFFEGNDIDDNVLEYRHLQEFSRSGQRPSREIEQQPSLIKALWTLVRDFKKLRLTDRSYANAYLRTSAGEVPVTIADAPPSSAQLTEEQKVALAAGLDRYVAAARQHGMKPHLLYLPCKRRTMHGLLRHGEGYPQPEWTPGDLPAYVAAECAKRGIGFIDATPALAAAAAAGKPAYNTIYDTHFDAEGHQLIGEVLARALRPSFETVLPAVSVSAQ